MIALDLGSNTLRVLAVSCDNNVLYNFNRVVKTADGLAHSNMINSQAVERIIDGIKDAQANFSFNGHTIKAVTTEALRRAKNSQMVLDKIQKETGIEFEIITGEEEARLTLLAVENRLKALNHQSKTFVTIDIGGGSTEITFKYENQVYSKSFPIGIVTIAQSYEDLTAIEKALPAKMQEMQDFCNTVYNHYGKVDSFVATAGTPTTVAAMKLGQNYKTYDASHVNGTTLKKHELTLYLELLLSMSFESLEITVGTGRTDLITAGILIYKELYLLLGFEECVVVDDGLREGVAIEMCA